MTRIPLKIIFSRFSQQFPRFLIELKHELPWPSEYFSYIWTGSGYYFGVALPLSSVQITKWFLGCWASLRERRGPGLGPPSSAGHELVLGSALHVFFPALPAFSSPPAPKPPFLSVPNPIYKPILTPSTHPQPHPPPHRREPSRSGTPTTPSW